MFNDMKQFTQWLGAHGDPTFIALWGRLEEDLRARVFAIFQKCGNGATNLRLIELTPRLGEFAAEMFHRMSREASMKADDLRVAVVGGTVTFLRATHADTTDALMHIPGGPSVSRANLESLAHQIADGVYARARDHDTT